MADELNTAMAECLFVLGNRVIHLCPSNQDPEGFFVDKDEIAHELWRLSSMVRIANAPDLSCPRIIEMSASKRGRIQAWRDNDKPVHAT